MSTYAPGAAFGATKIEQEGDKWTLVLVRELRHAPAKVWDALTDPAQLREWAPFDADRNLGKVGTAMLSTVGAPQAHVTESQITHADPYTRLEYSWGGQDIRWQLEPTANGGTRLTLWHNIDRRYIAMGAAGWHVCFDVLDHLLANDPIGRKVGPDAMKIDGFGRLQGEYVKQLGLKG